jgi:hypothetical protein
MRHDAAAQTDSARCYRSLADFYNADARRLSSRELDIGLWWRDAADGPLHRAAWIDDTGELYLAHLGPAAQGGGAVEVLATVVERERLERMLLGWRERCGAPGSLTWLRTRVRTLGRFSNPAAAPARRRGVPLRAPVARHPLGTAA